MSKTVINFNFFFDDKENVVIKKASKHAAANAGLEPVLIEEDDFQDGIIRGGTDPHTVGKVQSPPVEDDKPGHGNNTVSGGRTSQ